MPVAGAQPGVGAIVLVRDGAGRVLLVRQKSGPFAGSWILPGGGVERDEGVRHAATRELHEETGLTGTAGRVLAVYETRSDPPGRFDIVVFLYQVIATGALQAESGSEVRWFDPEGLADPHPTLRRALLDAGVRADDPLAIDAALTAAGIRMDRLS